MEVKGMSWGMFWKWLKWKENDGSGDHWCNSWVEFSKMLQDDVVWVIQIVV
jgi:hypothetical protein